LSLVYVLGNGSTPGVLYISYSAVDDQRHKQITIYTDHNLLSFYSFPSCIVKRLCQGLGKVGSGGSGDPLKFGAISTTFTPTLDTI